MGKIGIYLTVYWFRMHKITRPGLNIFTTDASIHKSRGYSSKNLATPHGKKKGMKMHLLEDLNVER
jgi:hypothetical protein